MTTSELIPAVSLYSLRSSTSHSLPLGKIQVTVGVGNPAAKHLIFIVSVSLAITIWQQGDISIEGVTASNS